MKYYRNVILVGVKLGIIDNFELQKEYILQPKYTHAGKTVQPIKYVADFFIEYNGGRCEVVDTKGFADSIATMKRKMFWFTHPEITFRWVGYSKIDGGWCDYEFIQQQRKKRKKEKQMKAV